MYKAKYYLIFNGGELIISDLNLNPDSGRSDIVHVFIVDKIKSHPQKI